MKHRAAKLEEARVSIREEEFPARRVGRGEGHGTSFYRDMRI